MVFERIAGHRERVRIDQYEWCCVMSGASPLKMGETRLNSSVTVLRSTKNYQPEDMSA